MPQPPPRNDKGEVVPHNHPEVLPQHNVIRRISEKQIITDAAGQRKISSIAFKPSSGQDGGMSVDLEAFIRAQAKDPIIFVTTPVWIGSVLFNVGALRQDLLMVGYDPIPENDCHGEVWGATTRAQWKRLQAIAIWYVPIPGVALG